MKKFWVLCVLAIFIPSPSVMTYHQLSEYPELSLRYKWLNKKLFSSVVEESIRAKEDYKLILAMIDAESKGKRTAMSKVGAIGYLQVMPSNYRGAKSDLFKERINLRTGISIFKMWKKHAKGDLILALNYYQRGFIPGANVKYLAKITNNYWSSL